MQTVPPPIPDAVPLDDVAGWCAVFAAAERPTTAPNDWVCDVLNGLFCLPITAPPTFRILASNFGACEARPFLDVLNGLSFLRPAQSFFGAAAHWVRERAGAWPALDDAGKMERDAEAMARRALDDGAAALDAFAARASAHLADAEAMAGEIDAVRTQAYAVRGIAREVRADGADTFAPSFVALRDALDAATRTADAHVRVYRARVRAADAAIRRTGGAPPAPSLLDVATPEDVPTDRPAGRDPSTTKKYRDAVRDALPPPPVPIPEDVQTLREVYGRALTAGHLDDGPNEKTFRDELRERVKADGFAWPNTTTQAGRRQAVETVREWAYATGARADGTRADLHPSGAPEARRAGS